MTPWGDSLARGLGQVDHSKPSLGMEILHLTGNFIFLAGLAGIMVITRRARRTSARKWARTGVWMQGIHGVEHLVDPARLRQTLTLAAAGIPAAFATVEPVITAEVWLRALHRTLPVPWTTLATVQGAM